MRKLTSKFMAGLMATVAVGVLARAYAQPDTQDSIQDSIVDEIIVRGVNIPDEKRATSEISSLLTPEKLARQGDSDIAEALRRVTGLSLSQGKFIVVRGLNERYSSLTLNGSPLPSPEPLRRVAPLDLFPVSVVGEALVQKTYSPQFSAEFGGGLIELRSKGVPDESFLELGVGAGINTETTFHDGLTYDGGDRDWTGFDDGTRNFPDPLAEAFGQFPGLAIRAESGVPEAQLREIGVSLVNSPLRVVQEGTTPANHNASLAGGLRADLDNGMSLGVTLNAGYGRDYSRKRGFQGDAQVNSEGEALVRNEEFAFESLSENITTNLLLAAGVEFDDNHKIDFTGLALRKTIKEARQSEGTENLSFGGLDLLKSNIEWFENQVWTLQGNSEHVFPAISDLLVNLRVAYAESFRDAPYETSYTYVRETGTSNPFRSAVALGSGSSSEGFDTRFSKVEDSTFSTGGDFKLPFLVGDMDVELKAGGAYTDNSRDYVLRQFGFRNDTGLPDGDPFYNQRIDFLLADQNIGEFGGFEFVELPDVVNPNAYNASLEVIAGYFGADVQFTPYLRAAAGFRYEDSEQIVDNFRIAGFSPPSNAGPETVLQNDYFLPAVTVTWNPTGDLQVRGGFSQTITRPQFQELGGAVFTDTDRDLQVFGNPFLVNTETDNYDIRAEYYFGRGQFITVGGFYKTLLNPIEESLFQTGDDLLVSYINAPEATLWGVEFEYEQRFALADMFQSGWLGYFGETKDLIVAANYTYSQSEVSAEGDVTIVNFSAGQPIPTTREGSNFFVDGRPLQGQSDHIVNFQIGYEDFDANSRATILLNWSSERIRQVGLIQGAVVPNVVERLPITLDFVYGRTITPFGSEMELQAKVTNILNDDYQATADGANDTSVPIDVYDLGTTFSVGLKKTF